MIKYKYNELYTPYATLKTYAYVSVSRFFWNVTKRVNDNFNSSQEQRATSLQTLSQRYGFNLNENL